MKNLLNMVPLKFYIVKYTQAKLKILPLSIKVWCATCSTGILKLALLDDTLNAAKLAELLQPLEDVHFFQQEGAPTQTSYQTMLIPGNIDWHCCQKGQQYR